ncbi:MAG: hypothetical protein GY719_38255 [bacterium]|nr:hypothetical protein [bacterium]
MTNPRTTALRIAAAIALALTLPGAVRADYQDLYRAGLRAFEFGLWREALVFFEAAIEQRPEAGPSVREYGMWQAPYLPYFHQGRALYHLGSYAEALEALEKSEAQGAILKRKSRQYHRELVRLRAEIEEKIAQEVRVMTRGAAADHEQMAALEGARMVDEGKLRALGPDYEEIDTSLRRTVDSLNADSLLDAASELRRATGLLDRARERFEQLKNEKEQRDRALERELARREREEQLRQARADRDRAAELIGGDGCELKAVWQLEDMEAGGLLAGEEDPADRPAALLGRAYLQCDRLQLAEQALARAEAGGLGGDHLASLTTDLAERRSRAPAVERWTDPSERVAAASDYSLAAAWAGAEECHLQAVSERIEQARAALGASPTGAASPLGPNEPPLPAGYNPDLVLARAHARCGDRDGVERHLELARSSSGTTSGRTSSLAELESWLARRPKPEPYTGSFALLIGAWDYSDAEGWPTLYKPGEDIREVRAALESHGFEVQSLENPSRQVLEQTLDEFFLRHGGEPSHRLVFYYAGHGHTEITVHGIKLGFLVPVDAGDPNTDRGRLRELFGMERFREYAIRSNANDILFMFDSCFAGTVFRATKSCALPNCIPPDGTDLSFGELVSRPVRMFLTAGDEEERVPDDSLFRRMVTRGLHGEADGNTDGFILGRELGYFVQNRVITKQRIARSRFKTSRLGLEPAEPKWGTLIEGSFGLGDLWFDVPREARRSVGESPEGVQRRVDPEITYWTAARTSADLRDYRHYLERFPGGYFAGLAEWILERADPEGRPPLVGGPPADGGR